jgi:hypothetical protein
LRSGRSYTYANTNVDSISNSKPYADANWDCNSNAYCKPDALHRRHVDCDKPH